jgi:hypothetical protein
MEQQTFQQPPNPPVQPKNWLVESILVTLFCCLPFGIVGIIFAAQVSSKWAAGDYAGSLQSSKDAARWTKIGFFVGLGIIVLYFIAIFGFGLTAFWANRRYSNY